MDKQGAQGARAGLLVKRCCHVRDRHHTPSREGCTELRQGHTSIILVIQALIHELHHLIFLVVRQGLIAGEQLFQPPVEVFLSDHLLAIRDRVKCRLCHHQRARSIAEHHAQVHGLVLRLEVHLGGLPAQIHRYHVDDNHREPNVNGHGGDGIEDGLGVEPGKLPVLPSVLKFDLHTFVEPGDVAVVREPHLRQPRPQVFLNLHHRQAQDPPVLVVQPVVSEDFRVVGLDAVNATCLQIHPPRSHRVVKLELHHQIHTRQPERRLVPPLGMRVRKPGENLRRVRARLRRLVRPGHTLGVVHLIQRHPSHRKPSGHRHHEGS
mmetsp:Transcript_57109/g.125247  ORF Transcript_57109/g.125247 Transcript_57109/m.125247 type:complete len:321 (-) Transcript_57109:587-1549(-)